MLKSQIKIIILPIINNFKNDTSRTARSSQKYFSTICIYIHTRTDRQTTCFVTTCLRPPCVLMRGGSVTVDRPGCQMKATYMDRMCFYYCLTYLSTAIDFSYFSGVEESLLHGADCWCHLGLVNLYILPLSFSAGRFFLQK